MKKLILSFVFVAMALGAFSQGIFSGGIEVGLPLGTFSDGWNAGFGVSARYEAAIQDKLNWTATGGFLSFGGKTISGFKYSSITIIPIQGGIKYFFKESNKGAYGGAEIGLMFASGGSSSETKFGFSPGIGYRTGKIDFLGKFNVVSDLNYFSIRAAYVF